MIFINVYRNTLLNRKNDVTYSKIFSFTSFDKINLLKLNMLATEKKFLRQYYKNFKKNGNNKKIFQESNTENFYGKFNWSKGKVRKFIYTHGFSKKDILPIGQDFNKKKIPLRRKGIIITRSLFKPELTFFSSDKLLVSGKKLGKYKQAFFFRNGFTIFFVKTLLDKYIGLNKFWRSLLLTVADLKMGAMLEHYDYFGLYSTSGNYISVHSSLQPKKSLFGLFTPFTKKGFLNIFYGKLYGKKFFKQKRYKFIGKFMELNFKSEGALERRMFRKLYLPLFGGKFEKTDPTQRFFFLSHYETYGKLLPNSTRSLFGFISPTTGYEKYLYGYPYHYSALFFGNFIKCLTDGKGTGFLNLRRYKVKFHHKNILFSLLNMFMSGVAGNGFTKGTDAHFVFPFMFAGVFLSKLFENKKNWLISSFVKDQSFSRTAKNYLLGRKKYAEVIGGIGLAFSLNWSSGKGFVGKVLEHESYSKLDYFKKAKYVGRDLVVESFTPFIRKDFVGYAEKFNYDPMNFNYKGLLRVLFPHQKIIEYNLLKSNNLYNYVKITKINRKFFSLLKIMWKGWRGRKKSLSDYKIGFPADFDFKAYAFNEHFTSFLHDIDVSQIFYTHPYENPYTYYHEIFFSCKKTGGFEFFFSKNLVLAATTIKFPILLTSRYYVEKFYFLIIKKADFKELCHLGSTVKNFTTAKNVAGITLYKRYLDQFSSVQQIYLFLIGKLEQNLMIHNDLYKNSILNQLLVGFEGEKFSSNSKIFLLVYLLHFFEYFNKKVINPKLLNSSILRFIFWKFFFFTHGTKIFFRPSMMVVKPYFTQTLRTIKGYPITHFRLIGTKKTSSTGILTALVNSLNVFSAPGFFNLTLNGNNPYYFSQDRKKDQLYTVSSQLVLDKFFNSDLGEKFAPILFDDMYEEITFSNYFIVNAGFTNSQFLLYMGKILYEIYPGNILDKDYFGFWYNYILVFDNQSTGVLTSKMRGNMSMYSYFIGPLTITLYETNGKLLTRVSTTEHGYLVTMLVLARLEVAQLKRLEALFPFQFDYKKFMLGRKHRFLGPYEEANFFFFLKNFIFKKFYSVPNFLEFELLSVFTNSLFLNLTRCMNLFNYTYSHFDKERLPTDLFPDTILLDVFFNKFKFGWIYFGFTENFGVNGSLINSYNSFLFVLLHFSGSLINNPIIDNLLGVYNLLTFNTFFDDYKFKELGREFMLGNFSYQNSFYFRQKLLALKLSGNTSVLGNFSFYRNFFGKLSASHFYTFIDDNNFLNSFNNQFIHCLIPKGIFLVDLVDSFCDVVLKKTFLNAEFYKTKLFKYRLTDTLPATGTIWKLFFFKFVTNVTYNGSLSDGFAFVNHYSLVGLSCLVNLLLVVFKSGKNFIFGSLLNFFRQKMVFLLFVLKLFFIANSNSSTIFCVLKVLLYFYYFSIFFLKFYINKFRFNFVDKFRNYFKYMFFKKIIFTNLKIFPGVFFVESYFPNNLGRAVYVHRKKFNLGGPFIYNIGYKIVKTGIFHASLSFVSYFLYNFVFKQKFSDYSLYRLPFARFYFLNTRFFFTANFLLIYFGQFFFIVGNLNKLTGYNSFYQFTGNKLVFLLIDKDSHYNYPELLGKQSAQLLANSGISSLLDGSFFWFAYVGYTTENMLFNNSYAFVPMNIIKFGKFLVFKKKKFIKNLVKPFKFYATKYISKGFRTTFYVTSLILFITKYNAGKRKLKNVYKLLKILAKKHFKKRKNISKKGLTISKPTKKRAKSFFTSKFNGIKHINGEFGARSFIKAVNNFLIRLVVKSNIVGNFDIDLFYLQLFTNSRFLISKKKNFTINAGFLANILIFYAKYFYLYFCGKNFFCNITSILKLRGLNLLLLTGNRGGAIHDTNFLKYVQKGQKLLPLGFDFGVNLVKLILIAYRFILFINLGLFKEIFNFHSILNKISFAFLPIFNGVAEHMDLSLNVYSGHLRGLCYQGLDCLRKLLPRRATDKGLIYFKNIAFGIANSPLIFKRLSLGYMKSYLSVLLCTHSNFLFDDNGLITFLFVSPSFILHKPNVKVIGLQNFTLAVKNMNNLHFSYSVYGLLLKNDGIKLNLPFLIALYFYFFLGFILLF